ncbi:MAG: alpha-galactosidase, partial [Actinomycetia bacterium]|nr:alpha-galactosidase [Actinomycetes bacterium]
MDEKSGLEIKSHYIIYDNSPAITRYISLRNTSDISINIQHLGSFSLYGIPFFAGNIPGREVLIHSFPSSWCWEGQMRTITAEEAGLFHKCSLGCWHVESTGSWSCKEYAPFFVIEEKKQKIFWCIQIEHSGSWRFEIGGPGVNEDCLYLQGGLGNFTYSHWSKQLMPGEEFESIKVSLCCTHGDIDNALNSMQKHRTNILINRSNSDKKFPVIFNEWLATKGGVREETVEEHLDALEGTGFEVYILDAGWYAPYGKGTSNDDWFFYVGDWEPNKKRFPLGIKNVADKIKQKGMIPGIWLEIEVAGNCSKSYINNQHLFMKNKFQYVEDNSRRFLYFGYSETREYATEVVEKLIDAGFRYFKIDYNVDCGLGCCNSGDSLGQGLVENVRGYYKWLDDLRKKYPDIIVENCSSGGNRMDYGMLSHTDLASITDQEEWYRSSGLFFGVSKMIHPSQMGLGSIVDQGKS